MYLGIGLPVNADMTLSGQRGLDLCAVASQTLTAHDQPVRAQHGQRSGHGRRTHVEPISQRADTRQPRTARLRLKLSPQRSAHALYVAHRLIRHVWIMTLILLTQVCQVLQLDVVCVVFQLFHQGRDLECQHPSERSR